VRNLGLRGLKVCVSDVLLKGLYRLDGWLRFRGLSSINCSIEGLVRARHMLLMSPLGHGVTSFPNRVLYSHTGPVGTTEDLSSQTTKLKYHIIDQVIQVTCKVT